MGGTELLLAASVVFLVVGAVLVVTSGLESGWVFVGGLAFLCGAIFFAGASLG